MENEWCDQFREWLTNNPSKINEVLKVYSRNSIKDMTGGRRTLDSIPQGKKLKLYEITGLDFFFTEVQTHPRDVDIEKIIASEQSRGLLHLKLEYDGIPKKQIAEKFGVSKGQFYNYLDGKGLSEIVQRKIENGLRSIYEYSQEEKPTTPLPTYEGHKQLLELLKNLNDNLQNIRTEISSRSPSYVAAGILSTNAPSLEQRIRTINTAIEILADQMDYFREAEQGERTALAQTINSDLWGYVAGILPRIDQPSSYQTVMRLMPKPKRSK